MAVCAFFTLTTFFCSWETNKPGGPPHAIIVNKHVEVQYSDVGWLAAWHYHLKIYSYHVCTSKHCNVLKSSLSTSSTNKYINLNLSTSTSTMVKKQKYWSTSTSTQQCVLKYTSSQQLETINSRIILISLKKLCIHCVEVQSVSQKHKQQFLSMRLLCQHNFGNNRW